MAARLRAILAIRASTAAYRMMTCRLAHALAHSPPRNAMRPPMALHEQCVGATEETMSIVEAVDDDKACSVPPTELKP